MTADGQIKSFFQRWENLEAEKKQVADLMKDLFIEAKSLGYQPKAMRAAFRLKTKQDLDSPADAEFEAVVDIYLDALNSSARNARLRTREKIEEFDPTTGEFLEDEQPETATETPKQVYGDSGEEATVLPSQSVNIPACGENAQEIDGSNETCPADDNSPETATRPGQDVQSPSQRAMAGENLDVTGGESAAAVERDAEATVEQRSTATNYRSDGGLNIVHKHTEIASASQGEAEAHSVERISPAETNTGSADANIGGDHEVADTHSFAAQAGASVQVAPAIILRPNCRNPENCGGYGSKHCGSCLKAITPELEAAE